MSILNFEWKALYNYLSFYKYPNGKDKINMVLEPLQAMIQLALLSLSPIGTKLTIQENILYLQSPNIIQPVSRWYNSDKKDDLYFLFQVIKRFIKWYNPIINKDSLMNEELYKLINAGNDTAVLDPLTLVSVALILPTAAAVPSTLTKILPNVYVLVFMLPVLALGIPAVKNVVAPSSWA